MDRYTTLSTRYFDLTADHIKLVRALCFEWEPGAYDGAPCVNEKRPYGSQGSYFIVEVLGWEVGADGTTDEQRERALALHRQTDVALEIICRAGEFRPGRYMKRFGQSWRPVEG